ncbi:WGxxGxxG family protein [Saccharothrix sp. NRRL B-16314]|uniref:WGxxGxxG family protein n=1 Tax=Saccharothrix sp. NRRL B-16314 TaxID=1463825 RepID=UPI00069146FF|nr:WGxxGxxG family protein [Saccharothrix sp. NRRL B-16314]
MKTAKTLVVAAVLGTVLAGSPAMADTSGAVVPAGVAAAQEQQNDDGGGSGNWGLLGLLGLLGLAGLARRKQHVEPYRTTATDR